VKLVSEVEILNHIRSDLDFIKEKIIRLEITINEIDSDVHKKYNPEYLTELEKIEKDDKRTHFGSIDEFDENFGL